MVAPNPEPLHRLYIFFVIDERETPTFSIKKVKKNETHPEKGMVTKLECKKCARQN